MRGYGTFNLPAGSWTDDSSLTLVLLESIKRNGWIDYTDIMDNFVKWLDDGEFTPYGYAYDIGRGTMNAIRKYKRDHKPHEAGSTTENNNGNGSLMRIMPGILPMPKPWACMNRSPASTRMLSAVPEPLFS
jgi:ADP-ribosylglycohydrolase